MQSQISNERIFGTETPTTKQRATWTLHQDKTTATVRSSPIPLVNVIRECGTLWGEHEQAALNCYSEVSDHSPQAMAWTKLNKVCHSTICKVVNSLMMIAEDSLSWGGTMYNGLFHLTRVPLLGDSAICLPWDISFGLTPLGQRVVTGDLLKSTREYRGILVT